MIERAIAAEVPFAWVAADSVYGVGEIETALRRAGKGYVLGVNGTHPFNSWGGKPPVAGTAEEIAQALPASAWARLSAGEGTKGARLHDWAYLELADLEAAEYDESLSGLWTRGLLIRRNIADGDLRLLRHLVPGRDRDRDPGRGRGPALGDRGRLRDRQERARPRPQRDPLLARLAPARLARHAGLRHAGRHPPPGQRAHAPKNPDRLARRRQT